MMPFLGLKPIDFHRPPLEITIVSMNCQKTITAQIRKRRLSLNLLRRDMSEKGGIQIKRL
jgi:hypothetical protein